MRVAVLDDYAGAFARLPAAGRVEKHEVVSFADSVTGDALVWRLDGFDAAILLQQRTPSLATWSSGSPRCDRGADLGAHPGRRTAPARRGAAAARRALAGVGRAAFFAESDVLSVHLPLTAETTGIVTAADLALMKGGALFVNTSRASMVASGALVAALEAGRPGHAAVDVFEVEPVLGRSDPLLALPNVTATPHLGYVEWDVLARLYGAAVDQVLAFAAGSPVNVVT